MLHGPALCFHHLYAGLARTPYVNPPTCLKLKRKTRATANLIFLASCIRFILLQVDQWFSGFICSSQMETQTITRWSRGQVMMRKNKNRFVWFANFDVQVISRHDLRENHSMVIKSYATSESLGHCYLGSFQLDIYSKIM